MSDLREQRRRIRSPRLRAFRAATLLCIGLLALLAFVQVTHVHAVSSDADHCPVCIVTHAAVPVAATAPAIVQVEAESSPAPVFESRPIVRYCHPSLFIRPPPSGC